MSSLIVECPELYCLMKVSGLKRCKNVETFCSVDLPIVNSLPAIRNSRNHVLNYTYIAPSIKPSIYDSQILWAHMGAIGCIGLD